MFVNAEATALNLLPCHLDDLRKSGLSDDTIRDAGIYTERDHLKLAVITGKPYKKKLGDALVFPFLDLDGQVNGFKRIKPLFPVKDRNGRAIKYLSPKGSTNRAYYPKAVLPALNNPQQELLITEGEKKALCATQNGFPCIGLVGVYGWKLDRKTDRLIPDLESVEWSGRQVYIAYDSDIVDKPEVRDAESRLATQLKARGARVKCVRIPDGSDSAKQGVDDFLVAHGIGDFRKLLDGAVEPDEIDKDAGRLPASKLDWVPEAKKFLAACCNANGKTTLITHRGLFLGWTGTHYREIPRAELEALLYSYLDRFAFGITHAAVTNILAAVRAVTHLRADIEPPLWLDKSRPGKDYIAMQNGILDIQALLRGEQDVLLPHAPEWFCSTCLPYAFDIEGKCPTWQRVVERNMEGDEERIAILQEWAGLCLVHDTGFHKFLTATGEGNNGKSVYCAGLASILGHDNVSHLPLECFGQRFRLFETYGKLANIIPECGEIDKAAEGVIKGFVSGDSMGFERKYEDTVNALPTARLLLATNTLPRFTDRSSGIWRRMLLVPFRAQITDAEKIRDLDKPHYWRQAGELPGMLNWALCGLARLREQGKFTHSALCEAELAKYRADCNPAAVYLAETCRVDPHGDLVTAELYRRYSLWCADNGFRALASNSFGREVQRAFPAAKQATVRNINGERVNGYCGVTVTKSL